MSGWARIGAILASLLSATAFADDTARARQLYQQGTTAFDLQRYADAAALYGEAYTLKNEPALLFNIGQAYRLAGSYQKAIGAFRSFLRHVPNARNRAEVEARISDMQRLFDDQQKMKPPTNLEPLPPQPVIEAAPAVPVVPPPPAIVVAPAPPPAPRRRSRATLIAGITTAVAGAVLVGVGTNPETGTGIGS